MKSQRKNKRLTIGFSALGDFRPVIGQEIVNGINKACIDFDINLVNFIGEVYKPFNEKEKNSFHYRKVLNFFNNKNLDGLISWSSSYYLMMTNEEIYKFHQNLNPLPLVSIGMPLPNVHSLFINDKMGIKEIMTHLITKHNKKNIAFVGIENKNHFSYIERFNTYIDTLKEFNIPFDKELYVSINQLRDKKEIKDAIDLLLNERNLLKRNKINAIITVSDRTANVIIDELHDRGINIPGEIAVTGFNNHLEGIRSIPALTTIEPHFFDLGYKAVETLSGIINGEKMELINPTPCELVVRESCGCDENIFKYTDNINRDKNYILSSDKENTIVVEIDKIIKNFNIRIDADFSKKFLKSILYDIDKGSSFKSIYLIKQNFLNYSNITESNLIRSQQIITDIKKIFTSFFNDDYNKILKLENIFHRAKSIIDSEFSYLSRSLENGQYGINAFIELSSELRMIDDINKIKNIIKKYFTQISIKNAYLFLFDYPKDDISSSELVFALSDYKEINIVKHKRIEAAAIRSEIIFDQEIRHTLIFEFLTFNNKYLGFILMEMGHTNIPLYDTIREILSPSVYFALQNKNINKNPVIIESVIKKINVNETPKNRSIDRKELLEYLSNNIHIMTDIELISKELNIPKSSLMKKSKQLTGYSIQKLHEMLKVEKAKEFLENTNNNIAEISFSLGYKDQLYFSRVFKKNTGMSPKKWIEKKPKPKKIIFNNSDL